MTRASALGVLALSVALLAASVHASPAPTREHAAAVDGGDRFAYLGEDAVSPEPIPTPPAEAFGDDFLDLLGDGPVNATGREFEWCANEGEDLPSCFCNGVVRYGSYGTKASRLANPDAPKWSYRRNCGNVDCAARDFPGEDPFPGEKKICQCTAPIPTPTPEPRTLKWTFCGAENANDTICECGNNSVVRYGSTGPSDVYAGGSKPTFFADHPEVTKWKYRDTPLHNSVRIPCKKASFPGPHPWPEGTVQEGDRMICQCAPYEPKPEAWCEAKPTPKPTFTPAETQGGKTTRGARSARNDGIVQPWELKWEFCANEGKSCNCPGVARYGFSGKASYYSDNSAWFKAHPDVLKWVNRDMSSAKNNGAMKCEAAQFGDIDPFPGHKKICQCARGVGIDVFEPYSVTESEAVKGNLKPKGTLPVTPQVIIKSASEAAVASVGSGEAKRVFHHEFQPRDRHLEARDLAGFTEAELELLHREDEVLAMKMATAAIASKEGDLPLLPGELKSGVDALADLGAPERGDAPSGVGFGAAALVAGAAAMAAVAAAAARAPGKSREEEGSLLGHAAGRDSYRAEI